MCCYKGFHIHVGMLWWRCSGILDMCVVSAIGRFVSVILRSNFLVVCCYRVFWSGFDVLWEVCFWVKVLGRANGVVWGFITDCFSKVVGCCAGF